MARIKSLKKDQREVRSFIRRFNKQLKDDCFSGRFEVKQVNRITKNLYNGWNDKTFISKDDTTFFGLAGHGNHLWYYADYEIEFVDNECPDRNFKKWFSKNDIVSGFLGNTSMYGIMNDFIAESDFWEK